MVGAKSLPTTGEFQGLFQTSCHLVPWTKYSWVVASNAVQEKNRKESRVSSPWLLPWWAVKADPEMGLGSATVIETTALGHLHKVLSTRGCTWGFWADWECSWVSTLCASTKLPLCTLKHWDAPVLQPGWRATGSGVAKDHPGVLEEKEQDPRCFYLPLPWAATAPEIPKGHGHAFADPLSLAGRVISLQQNGLCQAGSTRAGAPSSVLCR